MESLNIKNQSRKNYWEFSLPIEWAIFNQIWQQESASMLGQLNHWLSFFLYVSHDSAYIFRN